MALGDLVGLKDNGAGAFSEVVLQATSEQVAEGISNETVITPHLLKHHSNFTAVSNGTVPASGGSSDDFLCADGTWRKPNPTFIDTFIATAGQTTFTTSVVYTLSSVEVYYNGSKLQSTEYTANNGTSVVLTNPALSGAVIEIKMIANSASVSFDKSLAAVWSMLF